MSSQQAQQGAAILAALLTVALVAGVSAAAFWQQWRSMEVEHNQRQQLQSQWLIAGAMDWARTRVGEDGARSPGLDHNGEAWAEPVQAASLSEFVQRRRPLAGAQPEPVRSDEVLLDLQISDAQGRLNVLNLLEGQGLSPPWLAVFGRLFAILGLPDAELQRLVGQLRLANLGTLSGGATPSAPSPLVPTRQADLAWLGLAPATIEALSPHISLLPGPSPVNLNTAGAPVLQAVLNMPLAQVQQLMAKRQARPFAQLADAGLHTPNDQMQSVSSHFFEVQLRLWRASGAELARQEHALLQRDGEDVRTLWQRRLPSAALTPPALRSPTSTTHRSPP